MPTGGLRAVAVMVFASFAGSLIEVVGTSGIVATGGRWPLLGMWTFDAVLALVVAGAIVSVIRRMDRSSLISRILWVYVVVAATLAALLWGFAGRSWPYIAAMVGDRVLNLALHAAAWAVIRDAYGANPWALSRVTVACSVGAVCGTSSAVAAGAMNLPPFVLFGGTAVLLCALASTLSATAGAKAAGPLPRPSIASALALSAPRAAFESLRPTMPPSGMSGVPVAGDLYRALMYLRESQEVRLVAALGLFNGIAYTTLSYEVARLMGGAVAAGVVQERYGSLRTFEFFGHLGGEMFLAPLALRRWGFARLLGVTPAVLLAAMGSLLWAPSVAVAMLASTLLQLAFGFEALALGTAIASAPKSKRGRVGLLLEGTPYQVGYLVAIAFTAALLIAESLGLGASACRTASLTAGISSSVLSIMAVVLLARKRACMQQVVP